MADYKEFLAFEYVLAYCHDKAPSRNYTSAMDYGRAMDFFDSRNKLTQSGQLLARIIGGSLESAYA